MHGGGEDVVGGGFAPDVGVGRGAKGEGLYCVSLGGGHGGDDAAVVKEIGGLGWKSRERPSTLGVVT